MEAEDGLSSSPSSITEFNWSPFLLCAASVASVAGSLSRGSMKNLIFV